MLLARDVAGDGLAGGHLTLGTEGREVWADPLPCHALVPRAMHVLGSVIDRVGVVGRHLDGNHALEPVGQVPRVVAVEVHGSYVILFLLARGMAVATEASLAVAVDDVRVAGLGHGGSRLAPSDGLPIPSVAAGRALLRWVAGHHDRAVVLLARIEPVREPIVRVDLVQLCGGLVVLGGPGVTPVQGDVGAAVIGLDEDVWVIGVDPHVVVVPVGRRPALEGGPPVRGLVEALVVHVDDFGVLRIGIHVRVVERTVHQPGLVARQPPGLAAVVGAIEALVGVGGLHQGVDAVGICRGYRQVDLADEARGQPLRHDPPGLTAIRGLPDPVLASRGFHAGDDGPRFTLSPPHGGVDLVGVEGVELEIDGTDRVRREQDPLPGASSVGGLVDPAFRVPSPCVPECRDIRHIRISRVNLHGPELPGVTESEIAPGLSGIVRAVDAQPPDHVGADTVGAGAYVDHR